VSSKHIYTVDIDPIDPKFFHLKQAMEEISKKKNSETLSVLLAVAVDIRQSKIDAEVSEILLQAYFIGLRKIARGDVIHNPVAWLREESRKVIKTWPKG
jgi:hypothetical protein